MTLRPHQILFQNTCIEILGGAPIRQIIVAVTPGGGKSALPVIAAQLLIAVIADKLIWIAPRNSLKYQGEAEFVDPRWQTPRRLRATNGNEPAPDRGADGYLTTFQAIGMSPGLHQEYVRRNRTIVFLDEAHHVADQSTWHDAIQPVIDAAVLVVYASGTLSRGDGKQIAGLGYDGLQVDLEDTDHTRVIRYGRGQAIKDEAILPVHPKTLDGAATWNDEAGIKRSADSIAKAGQDSTAALFTALRTEYAYQLLDACTADWTNMCRQYPQAKLLVVAPNIEQAKRYLAHIAKNYLAEIATSEDSTACRRSIEQFKQGAFHVLVTVGVAYEGLSVPEITHIACLTHIRSVPWLEQCFARANRKAPGKPFGVVWGPADRAFLEAGRMIELEQIIPLKERPEDTSTSGSGDTGQEGNGAGPGRPGIQPLWSAVIGAENIPGMQPDVIQGPAIAPSEAERILRENIRAIRKAVIEGARPGSQQALQKIFDRVMRQETGRPIEEQNSQELEASWMVAREKFGGRL